MGRWEMVKLGDVCEILDHMRIPVTASDRKPGIYPYYGANGVQDYISDFIFDDELVLLAEDGGNFGSKTRPIAYRVSGKCWVNNHAHVLKPKSMLDVDYLCYSIMFYDVSKIISGTTRAKLTQAAVRQMTIPLPPLETQKQIAKILDTAAELLAMRKQQLAELDNLIKSTFYDMFGDPVSNEKGWEPKKLIDITIKIGSGATPRGGKESYKHEGISLIRSMNVHNGVFSYEQLAYLDDKQAKQLDNVTVEENDVLINITGASVARSCIVPHDVLPARVNQHVTIIRLKKEKAIPEYINNVLTSSTFQTHLLSIGGAGGATREAITKQQLQNLVVPLPPLALQTQFAEIVTRIEEQKALVQKAVDETQYLFDSLMSEYFD